MRRNYFGVALATLVLLASGWLTGPACAGTILSQNFDDTGTFFPGIAATVGDPSNTGGEWAGFNSTNLDISTAFASSGTQSLSVTRSTFSTGFATAGVSAADYVISYNLYLPSTNAGSLITHVGNNASSVSDLRLATFVQSSGQVNYRNSANTSWPSSGAFIPLDQWTEVRLEVDENAGTYDLFVGGAFALTVTPNGFPADVNGFRFNPQQTAGTVTYVDDVSITDTAIPEPSSLALLGLGALALVWRRKV